MRQIREEVLESAHKAEGVYPCKFVCPEVSPGSSQPDRFWRTQVIALEAVADEQVPCELTDALALVLSGDTVVIDA